MEIPEPAAIEDYQPGTMTLPEGRLAHQRLLRLLPGQRIVLQGQWQATGEGRPVEAVLKAYWGPDALEDWQQEVQRHQWLAEAGMPVPAILAQGHGPDKAWLVTAFVPHQQTLADIAGLSPGQESLLATVGRTFARLNLAGALHRDPHPANVLVISADEVCLIDCADISTPGRVKAGQQLPLLLAQFPLASHREAVLDGYCREWPQTPQELESIRQQARQQLVACARARAKKSLRASTAFLPVKSGGLTGMVLRPCQALCESPLRQQWLEWFAPASRAESMKAGRSAQVAAGELVVSGQSLSLVIKRYAPEPGLKAWLQQYGPRWQNKALRSWYFGHFLRRAGIRTPEPVFFLRGNRGESYIAWQRIDGPELRDWVASGPTDEESRQVFARIGDMLDALQSACLYHGDLKARNWLVDSQLQPWLIDLDSTRFLRWRWQQTGYFRKDWQRFVANGRRYPAMQPMIEALEASRTLQAAGRKES